MSYRPTATSFATPCLRNCYVTATKLFSVELTYKATPFTGVPNIQSIFGFAVLEIEIVFLSQYKTKSPASENKVIFFVFAL